ncbi:MAG TPA: hypothetical protein DCS90_05745 [Ktedonobacter sp.]|nr:hypothetical protein [Ktedonobacter sp.]
MKGSHDSMVATQHPVSSTNMHRGMLYRIASSRLFRSILIGIAITLLLICIELAIIWFFNPVHLLGNGRASPLLDLASLPFHMPLLLLVPLVELGGTTIVAYLAVRPLAFRAYLRDVQREQEAYRRMYTQLDSLAHISKTAVTYFEHTPDPLAINQGRSLSLLELVELPQEASLLLEGAAGAGKTFALEQYRFSAVQQRKALLRGQQKIPVYVPLKNYSVFIKAQNKTPTVSTEQHTLDDQNAISEAVAQQATLLDFLIENDFKAMRHLRPYLNKLLLQGRLLFLCDGLDEVDQQYRAAVGKELAEMLLVTQNRFVITCREVDYRKLPELEQLVNEGHIERAVIDPLQLEQVRGFVEDYIAVQGDKWQHTAGQIMQVLLTGRLRYLCTNPLMLFSFLEIIDKVGVERGKKLDTRGLILREYVAQLIQREQKRPEWKKAAPLESDVLRLLSKIAYAAYWSNDRDCIQLPAQRGKMGAQEHIALCASELLTWLKDHPTHDPASLEQEYDQTTLTQLLDFAQKTSLIELSSGGILSFRHELIAKYFVATYFLASDLDKGGPTSPLLATIPEELLANVSYWSEPMALYAGLLETPMQLAEQFATLGSSPGEDAQNPSSNQSLSILEALALSLVSSGVAWMPPTPSQAATQRESALPPRMAAMMTRVLHDQAACEDMARLVQNCYQEGADEIYRSLMLLLPIEGVEEFFVLLDTTIVPKLLFSYLSDTADALPYENQVKRLSRVLSRFGGSVVACATELSLPVPTRSVRLRAAAINILGGTRHPAAVEPLIARLNDNEQFIIERAINALIRLGPELSVARILQELGNRTSALSTRLTHAAALTILERFLYEQEARHQGTPAQYQRILQGLIMVLTSNYALEQEIQQQAREILVRIAARQAASGNKTALNGIPEKVLPTLIQHLSSSDELLADNMVQTLQAIGPAATPFLLDQLKQQPTERVRIRILEVLKNVHDPSALPAILRLIADPSQLVLQQVTSTLHSFSVESIPGLIDLIRADTNDTVAERAAQMLAGMGKEVVETVSRALTPIVINRTHLLVQVLEQVRDERVIPSLISLVKPSQTEQLLAIAVIHALSQFPTTQVVSPLMEMLESPQPQIYEEAIEALSSLGSVALDELLAALNVQQETTITSRIRRALLGMVPFPGEQLLGTLSHNSDAQAQQILMVFQLQGADAAHVLVEHLFDQDQRIKSSVHRTLAEMQGQIVVPPLLEALNRSGWSDTIARFLLNYPEVATPPLVNLLGDSERGDAAASILPRFDYRVLPILISALDDPRILVQEHAQNIIVTMVRQNPTTLSHTVRLFSQTLPLRAHEALLEVLTNELVDVSIPALLGGLEDAHLVDDVSEALARLSRKRDWQRIVLNGLLESLRMEDRRRGAVTALIKVGGPAVRSVSELITDQDEVIARTAQHILQEIGAPALPFIWAVHGDMSNRARREAAMNIFHNMPTEEIKDALVDLLISDQPEDIAMAQALLLERIHDEKALSTANQEMIPALLQYVQIHDRERTSLRIMALLFLQGGDSVVRHLVQVLYDHPEHHEQLAHAFLFLGDEAQNALLRILNDPHAPALLRAEAISMIGLLGPAKDVYEYAQSVSKYGLSQNRMSVLNFDELSVSLRAVGSLLASGDWDIPTLQHLRQITQKGSHQSELYNVLLGWRYEPDMLKLRNDLQNERDARKSEIISLTARIVQDQAHINDIEDELKHIQHEHGQRGDELSQATQERDSFRKSHVQAMQEKETIRQNLSQISQERERYRANLDKTLHEKQALQAEISQLEAYNKLLQQQINLLRGKTQA